MAPTSPKVSSQDAFVPFPEGGLSLGTATPIESTIISAPILNPTFLAGATLGPDAEMNHALDEEATCDTHRILGDDDIIVTGSLNICQDHRCMRCNDHKPC